MIRQQCQWQKRREAGSVCPKPTVKVSQGSKGSQGLTENLRGSGREGHPALPLAVKTQAFSRLVVEITCWGSRRPAWALLEASWAAGHCSVAGGLGQPQRGTGWGWEGHPCQTGTSVRGHVSNSPQLTSTAPPHQGDDCRGRREPWPEHRLRVGPFSGRVHRGHHHFLTLPVTPGFTSATCYHKIVVPSANSWDRSSL